MDGKKTTEQPKRRACDECRGRKLACSKELDGCSRCQREGVKCVYSPQKRMGRPRKHRPAEPMASGETSQEASQPQKPLPQPPSLPPVEAAPTASMTIPDPQSIIFPDFNFDSAFGMDLDLSFLDMSSSDMNFLDMVDPNSQFIPFTPQANLELPEQLQQKQPQTDQQRPSPPTSQNPRGHPPGFWPLRNYTEINFDEPADDIPTPLPNLDLINEDLAQIMSFDLAESLPSLSPPSSSETGCSPSSDTSAQTEPAASFSTTSTPTTTTTTTCACPTNLQQSLTTLQPLPSTIPAAIFTTRRATRAAYEAVLCPVCSDPPFSLHSPSLTFQSVQTMLMLGALLPSLSAAYTRLLELVDQTASAADAARKKLRFSLTDYGGVWGWMAQGKAAMKCGGGVNRLEGALMEPMTWRLVVRAMLKMDVYGVGEWGEEGKGQLGLKELARMVEGRAKVWHERLDVLVNAGVIERPRDYRPPSELEEQEDKPPCMRIIEAAKKSVEGLVIP